MTTGARVAAAALATVGARYRLHGRDVPYGLDCVGVAGLALRAAGFKGEVPCDYKVRGEDGDAVMAAIDARLLTRIPLAQHETGDLLLFAAGPAQFHMAVGVPGGFVHADAMLRRVVERPWPAPWRLVAAWRWQEEA